MKDIKLIGLAELADRTGLSVVWLKRETDARRLPCIRAGRRRMFSVDAVRKTLARRAGALDINNAERQRDRTDTETGGVS